MPSVYIESTIPSYYHEARRTPRIVAWREATRRWWDAHRMGYELCTSALTFIETSAGPKDKSDRAIQLLHGVRVLEELPGMAEVIDYYVEHRLMPQGAGGDAGHLAFASMHGIDFLLTWNCKHLANANKIRHLQVLNARLGLSVPILTTPLNLIPEESSDEENEPSR